MTNYNNDMKKNLTLRVSRALRRIFQARANMLVSRLFSRLNLAIVLDVWLTLYYKRTSRFITWDLSAIGSKLKKRPYSFSSFNLEQKLKARESSSFPNPFGGELCIVIQGKVIAENFLTRNIVAYYLSNFNDIKIILSTWDDISNTDLAAFEVFKENPRFLIILTTPLDFPGVFNVNNQIVTTSQGLKHAIEISEFAIKTRTDQLLSSPMVLKNLYALWNTYGLNNASENRIVISSFNTFAFRFYGASDMFQFGKTQDLINYWSQDLDRRPNSELTKSSDSMRSEGKKLVAEVYLNTNYFEKVMGTPPNFSWKENLEFTKNAFVIADKHSLGQLWVKNTHLTNRWDFGFFPHKYYEFSHLDWVGLSLDLDEWLNRENLVDCEEFYAFE